MRAACASSSNRAMRCDSVSILTITGIVGTFFLGGSSLASGVTAPLMTGVVGTLVAAAADLMSRGVPSGRVTLTGLRGVKDAADPESKY